MPSRSALVALVSLGLTTAPALAQGTLRPASVDVGVGVGFGRGGGLRHARDGVAASALVAWRVRALSAGAMLVGLGGSAQAPTDGSDDCLLAPGGGCVPNYPGLQSVGALGGWGAGRGRRGSAVRALAGPAVFRSDERATALGLQARVDVATPSVAHLALVAWGQAALVPRLRSEAYRLGAVGLGLRVQ
jgi:hypothetical protein